MVRESERDARFRRRVQESAKRVVQLKKQSAALKRRAAAPSPEKISRLSTQLWEFGEQIHLRGLLAGVAAGAGAGE